MRSLFFIVLLLFTITDLFGQIVKKPTFSGLYFQWGYNRDWYSKSDLHFGNGSQYNFTVHGATASDSPDFEAFSESPIDITIPQNSVRLGMYLNKDHTHAIELNFDHAKYVMNNNQTRRVSGEIHGEPFDKDTIVNSNFVHFEHTDGANFLHLNYVGQIPLLRRPKRILTSAVYRIGAGIVIPRSDVTIMGSKLDNKYHVAGYIMSLEGGLRFYPIKNLFLEADGKMGFANYLNALTVDGGSAKHKFYYAEVIGLVGYDIHFKKKQKTKG